MDAQLKAAGAGMTGVSLRVTRREAGVVWLAMKKGINWPVRAV